MDSESEDEQKIYHAVIRFYVDQAVKVVPVTDIQDFSVEDNYKNRSYYIKRNNPITGSEEFEPAEIFDVSTDSNALVKNSKRYKLTKKRRSDAIIELEKMKHSKEKKKNKKNKMSPSNANSQRRQKTSLKKKIKTKQEKENADIVQKKLKSMKYTKSDTSTDGESDDLDKIVKEKLKSMKSFDLNMDTDERSMKSNNSNIEIQTYTEEGSPTGNDRTKNNKTSDLNNILPNDSEKDDILYLKSVIEQQKEIITREQVKLQEKVEKIIELESEIVELNKKLDQFLSQEKPALEENIPSPRSTPSKILQPKQLLKSNTAKDHSTKTKKGKAEKEYDTDDFNNSDSDEKNRKNFESWEKTINGKQVQMFHLCYGVSILYSQWKILKKSPNSSIFVRTLAEYIWGNIDLMNRAIDITKVTTCLPNRSPVHECTPKKMSALKKSYRHFLILKKIVTTENLQAMSAKEKAKIMNAWRTYLKAKINSLRTKNRSLMRVTSFENKVQDFEKNQKSDDEAED